MIVKDCKFFPGSQHTHPDDWIFGGADGDDPRADPRFEPNNYTFYDENVQPIWTTSTPICDDEAIDMFTWVASLGNNFNPHWLSVRRKDGKEEMFPLTYDKSTDTVTEKL